MKRKQPYVPKHGTRKAIPYARLITLAAVLLLTSTLLMGMPHSLADGMVYAANSTEQTPNAGASQSEESVEPAPPYTPPPSFDGFYDPNKKTQTEEEQTPAEETPPIIKPSSEPRGTTEELRLSVKDIMTICASMGDGVPTYRAAVVLKGYTLMDKIGYFWAGKSLEIGWDNRWGNEATVVGKTESAGQIKPYGMDCSGYVSWCFINAAGECTYASSIGNGTNGQWARSVEIPLEEAQVGDLAFFHAPSDQINHVGILAGRDENGDWLVINCASGMDTVGITKLPRSGFRHFRRPLIYGEDREQSDFAQKVEQNGMTDYGADIQLYDALSAFPSEAIAEVISQK